ncbi:MAG: hypothetical protein AAF390_17835 [Pseudomonadota bacterium]
MTPASAFVQTDEPGLSSLLPDVPLPAGGVDCWNDALRRMGPLAVEMGGETLRLSPWTGPADQSSWWRIGTSPGELIVGLSGTLAPEARAGRDELAFETHFDPILTALETYLAAPVEVVRALGDRGTAGQRRFAAEWGGRRGMLTVGYGPEAAALVADLLRALPFAAAPPRDIELRSAIEIGRCDLSHDDLAKRQVGDLLLPRSGELSAETGRLMVGDLTHGTVDLGDGTAVMGRVSAAVAIEEDAADGLAVRLPCRSMSRSRLNGLAAGDRLDLAGGRPGQVDLVRGGRSIGSGQLVRFGDRLAVELRRIPRDLTAKKIVTATVSSGSRKVAATSFEGKDAEGDRVAEVAAPPDPVADVEDTVAEEIEWAGCRWFPRPKTEEGERDGGWDW